MPVAPIYIISALLVFGAAPLPYGYYTLLRIAASGFFLWAVFVAFEKKFQYLLWAFALLALLFNPIIPIHFPKEFWVFADVGSAIFIMSVKSKLLAKIHEST